MVTNLDLQDCDVGWIATDAIGQIALFITAGRGPIPGSALPSVESSEELVLSLPERSDVDLVTSMPSANAFVAFAKRGLFAYDWSDLHRTARQALNGYELQCRPLNPLTLFDLPASLRVLAEGTRLSGITFGMSIVIVDWN